jgi:hypothetical protein
MIALRDGEAETMATYLAYLGMLGLAAAGYFVGKALWNRSVGATWLVIPAILAYMVAFWLAIATSILTRGLVLLFGVAVWGGLWLGKRLARRSARSSQ